MTARKSSDSEAQAEETITTRDGLTAKVLAPPDPGKTVTLTGPGGTKVTAPESSAAALKAAGYK